LSYYVELELEINLDIGGRWEGEMEELPDCEEGFRGNGVLLDFGEGDGV
jgi:hypothetical protein